MPPYHTSNRVKPDGKRVKLYVRTFLTGLFVGTSVRPRLFVLCALTLFCMFGVGTVQAAEYPYFGPLPDIENYVYTGFLHAWNLFGRISDPSQGLFYLALTGALIGLALIILRPENQKLSTVLAWLALVLMLIVAPVGSRLLFSDIKDRRESDLAHIVSDGGAGKAQHFDIKGFTPQVVVLHVASTIHDVLLAYFNSHGYMDAVRTALSHQGLQSNLTMPDEAYQAARKYLEDPNCKGKPIQPAAVQTSLQATSGTNAVSTEATTETYQDVLNKIKTYYNNTDTNGTIPPPAIAIYTEASQLPQSWQSQEKKLEYLQGLKTFCKEAGYSQKQLKEGACSGSGQTQSVDQDIAKIAKELFASPAYTKDQRENSGSLSWNPGKWFNSACSNRHLGNAHYCTADQLGLAFFITPYGVKDTPALIARRPATKMARGGGSMKGVHYYTEQPRYAKAIKENSKLVKLGSLVTGISSLPVVATHVTKKGAVHAANTCEKKSADVADTIIDAMFTGQNKDADYRMFTPQFVEMLKGTLPWPTGNLDVKQLHSSYKLSTFSVHTDMVNFYNNVIAPDNKLTVEQKRAKFLHMVLGMAYTNTQQSKAKAEQKRRADNALEPTTVGPLWGGEGGSTWLGRAVSWLGFVIADGIGRVVAQVAGILAKIFIKFLIVFVNMTMTAVLIITPLAMLVGLVVPSYALGIITLFTLSIFILKVVPITFMIVNQITSLLYQILGRMGNGGVLDALLGTFEQGVLLIAAAFMYLSIVGITLFIMFKIGDPSNVAQLAALDSAAKGAAAAGLALATAAAAGGGVALAGAGRSLANKGNQAKKEALAKNDEQLKELEEHRGTMTDDEYNSSRAALEAKKEKLEGGSAFGYALGSSAAFENVAGALKTGAVTGAWQTGEAMAGIGSSMLPGTGYGMREVANMFSEGGAQADAIDKRGAIGHIGDRWRADSNQYRKQEAARIQASEDYKAGDVDSEFYRAEQMGRQAAGSAISYRDQMGLEFGAHDPENTFDSLRADGLMDQYGELTALGEDRLANGLLSNQKALAGRAFAKGLVDEKGNPNAKAYALAEGGSHRGAAATLAETMDKSGGNTADDAFIARQNLRKAAAQEDQYVKAMKGEFKADGAQIGDYANALRGQEIAGASQLKVNADAVASGSVTDSDFRLSAAAQAKANLGNIKAKAMGIKETGGSLTVGEYAKAMLGQEISSAEKLKVNAKAVADGDVTAKDFKRVAGDQARAELGSVKSRAEALDVMGEPTIRDYKDIQLNQDKLQVAGVRRKAELARTANKGPGIDFKLDMKAENDARAEIDGLLGELDSLEHLPMTGIDYRSASKATFLKKAASTQALADVSKGNKASDYFESEALSAREQNAQMKARAAGNAQIKDTELDAVALDNVNRTIGETKKQATALRMQGAPTVAQYASAGLEQNRLQIEGVKAAAKRSTDSTISTSDLELLADEGARQSIEGLQGNIDGINERIKAGKGVNYRGAARANYLQSASNTDATARHFANVKADQFYADADLGGRNSAAKVVATAAESANISDPDIMEVAMDQARQMAGGIKSGADAIRKQGKLTSEQYAAAGRIQAERRISEARQMAKKSAEVTTKQIDAAAERSVDEANRVYEVEGTQQEALNRAIVTGRAEAFLKNNPEIAKKIHGDVKTNKDAKFIDGNGKEISYKQAYEKNLKEQNKDMMFQRKLAERIEKFKQETPDLVEGDLRIEDFRADQIQNHKEEILAEVDQQAERNAVTNTVRQRLAADSEVMLKGQVPSYISQAKGLTADEQKLAMGAIGDISEEGMEQDRMAHRTAGARWQAEDAGTWEYYRKKYDQKYAKGETDFGQHYIQGSILKAGRGASDLNAQKLAIERMADMNWDVYNANKSRVMEAEYRVKETQGRSINHNAFMKVQTDSAQLQAEEWETRAIEVDEANSVAGRDMSKNLRTMRSMEREARFRSGTRKDGVVLLKANRHGGAITADARGRDVEGREYNHDNAAEHYMAEFEKMFRERGESQTRAVSKAKRLMVEMANNANASGKGKALKNIEITSEDGRTNFVAEINLETATYNASKELRDALSHLENTYKPFAKDGTRVVDDNGNAKLVMSVGESFKNNEKVKAAIKRTGVSTDSQRDAEDMKTHLKEAYSGKRRFNELEVDVEFEKGKGERQVSEEEIAISDAEIDEANRLLGDLFDRDSDS